MERSVRVVAEGAASLDRIHDQFRDRHVRGAARRLLLWTAKGDSTSVMLNRQAAIAGAVVLCSTPDESPLGPIHLKISSNKINAVIDWLTAYEEG